MKNVESKKQLLQAMVDFNAAYETLRSAIEEYEQESHTSVNDLQGFVRSYPFDKSFDELAIGQWVTDTIEDTTQCTFKVLNYQYLNTGGNTMVGIHEVWLPELKKVVYALTNEEGCTLAHVDYISNELEIDDYDELMIESVDWGRVTGYEKYFELYRYCYNQYLVDDCKYFGITRGTQYHLLSDELQKMVSTDYLKYIEDECGGLIETDGKIIVTDPDYEVSEVDVALQSIKNWLRWHDNIAADESRREAMYEEHYQLTLAGKTVRLPFYAETFNLVNDLLKGTIEDW